MATRKNTTGNPYLAELLRGNEEVIARVRELAKEVTPEKLAMRAPAGGWTAAQALEHVIVSGKLYTDRFDAIIAKARNEDRTRDRPWKPSLVGGAIMRSIHPRNMRKRKTFRVFEPGPEPRANVVRELAKFQEDVSRYIRMADGLDLRAVRLSSPVSPMLRMNLGDALGILVFHAQRHVLQAERIWDHADPG